MGDKTSEWIAAHDRDEYKDDFLAAADAVADAARDGRWDALFTALESSWMSASSPNVWRPGGASGFTPLHQAAWHGAPVDVVERLVDLGAWRTLRATNTKRAVDVARDRGHDHLVDALTPSPVFEHPSPYTLDGHLTGLIEARVRPALGLRLRYPQSAVVHETGDTIWCPVPGMYGGFSLEPDGDALMVSSWIRVVGGSGQRHRIDTDGCHLIERGFV